MCYILWYSPGNNQGGVRKFKRGFINKDACNADGLKALIPGNGHTLGGGLCCMKDGCNDLEGQLVEDPQPVTSCEPPGELIFVLLTR